MWFDDLQKHLKSSQEPLVEDLLNSFSTCSVSSPVHMQEEPHAEGDMSSEVDIVVKPEAADIFNGPGNPLRSVLSLGILIIVFSCGVKFKCYAVPGQMKCTYSKLHVQLQITRSLSFERKHSIVC